MTALLVLAFSLTLLLIALAALWFARRETQRSMQAMAAGPRQAAETPPSSPSLP